MVTARPWNASTIVRFILCLVASIFCGWLLVAALQHPRGGNQEDVRFYRLIASALGCVATSVLFVYRPWTVHNPSSRLAGYSICLYAGFFLGAWAQKKAPSSGPSITQMIIASLSLQGAALVLIPHFLREQRLGWEEAFGFANNRREALMLGVILACIFLPIGIGLQWLSALLMVHVPFFQLKPEEQESVQTLQLAVTWLPRVVLGVVTILLAPAAEELVFRGILYPAIKKAGFPRLALWGTALLFAAVHMNLVTFIPLAVLALGLTLLYERTDNLLASITAHALFNLMNFAMLYSRFGPFTPGK